MPSRRSFICRTVSRSSEHLMPNNAPQATCETHAPERKRVRRAWHESSRVKVLIPGIRRAEDIEGQIPIKFEKGKR